MSVLIRDVTINDAPAIHALYAQEVARSFANYEYDAPELGEMQRRIAAVVDAGMPWLVAEIDGVFSGYAYASSYRSRAGYRWTIEDTVYVEPGFSRRGIGHALLATLIERSTALGYRQMIAVIGDANNTASIALHEKMGFQTVGTFRGIGYKHHCWLDNVQMQRMLGVGSAEPPSTDPDSDDQH